MLCILTGTFILIFFLKIIIHMVLSHFNTEHGQFILILGLIVTFLYQMKIQKNRNLICMLIDYLVP